MHKIVGFMKIKMRFQNVFEPIAHVRYVSGNICILEAKLRM